MERDMRRINKIWEACNELGEWHTFAIIGSGKNLYVATLHTGAMRPSDNNRLGSMYRIRQGATMESKNQMTTPKPLWLKKELDDLKSMRKRGEA